MKKIILLIVVYIIVICCNSNRAREIKVLHKEATPKVELPKEVFKNNCSYVNNVSDLGVGVLLWNFNCDENISFYNDKNLKQKEIEINFCEKINQVLCPLFYKPDYGIMHFAVTTVYPKSYEIILNYSEKRFISKRSSFIFVGWEAFFKKHVTSIRKNNISYEVLSYDGVYLNCLNLSNKKKEKLRWKKDNLILVDVTLLY